MNYAEVRPILFLPPILVVDYQASFVVRLPGLASRPFSLLTVSVSGPSTQYAVISLPPVAGEEHGGDLDVSVPLVAESPGEREIEVRILLTSGDPVNITAEGSVMEIRRRIGAIPGISEHRSEAMVIADLARVPGLNTVAGKKNLGEAMHYVWETCGTWHRISSVFKPKKPNRTPPPAPANPQRPPNAAPPAGQGVRPVKLEPKKEPPPAQPKTSPPPEPSPTQPPPVAKGPVTRPLQPLPRGRGEPAAAPAWPPDSTPRAPKTRPPPPRRNRKGILSPEEVQMEVEAAEEASGKANRRLIATVFALLALCLVVVFLVMHAMRTPDAANAKLTPAPTPAPQEHSQGEPLKPLPLSNPSLAATPTPRPTKPALGSTNTAPESPGSLGTPRPSARPTPRPAITSSPLLPPEKTPSIVQKESPIAAASPVESKRPMPPAENHSPLAQADVTPSLPPRPLLESPEPKPALRIKAVSDEQKVRDLITTYFEDASSRTLDKQLGALQFDLDFYHTGFGRTKQAFLDSLDARDRVFSKTTYTVNKFVSVNATSATCWEVMCLLDHAWITQKGRTGTKTVTNFVRVIKEGEHFYIKGIKGLDGEE